MPNRVIKDSIWSSKSLAKLKPYYQDQWTRWLLMADDWGCFNADREVIKGLVYPKRGETKAKVQAIRQVYHGAGMLFLWEQNGREWGFFTSWDNYQFCNKLSVGETGEYTKHRRKTPAPPEDLLTLYLQEHTEEFDKVQQDSTKLLNPIPNPKHNPNPNPKPIVEEDKYKEWLTAWNEKGPGPKHAKLGAKAGEYIYLLTTEGAADGEVWTLDKFTTAVEIYTELLKAGRWKYKWPSLTDLLSRTLNQKTGPGLMRFLPGEDYDPRKELGLREGRKGSAPGAGSYRATTCKGEIFDGEGTCPDIELNEQGVCAKQKTCPNFRKHE